MNNYILRRLLIIGSIGFLLYAQREQVIGATSRQVTQIPLLPAKLVLTQDKICTTQRVSPQTITVAPSGRKLQRVSSQPIISAEGYSIAYESSALITAEEDSWESSMIFVVEPSTGIAEQVDVNNQGQPANNISNLAGMSLNGRYVAFVSYATNLVDGTSQGNLFIRDRLNNITELVPIANNLRLGLLVDPSVSLSVDGRYVVFGNLDLANVYLYDRELDKTELISLEPENTNRYSFQPTISADGRYVAFTSGLYGQASNSVYVRDHLTGSTEVVSVSWDGKPVEGSTPAISVNGRYIAFASSASNIVKGDTNNVDDIFVRDQVEKSTKRASVSSTGQQANGFSMELAIAPGGHSVAFKSKASNLVEGDTNKAEDVFVHDLNQNSTERVSISITGQQANDASSQPTLAISDRAVAFTSEATNLVEGDTNSVSDVFVRMCSNNRQQNLQ
jgi:hypothetical protein